VSIIISASDQDALTVEINAELDEPRRRAGFTDERLPNITASKTARLLARISVFIAFST
jgi:hypothetical protein